MGKRMDRINFIPAVRRIASIAAVLAVPVLMVPQTVLAGNINGSESGLISQASGTFTYEGKSYVATAGALGQLRAYLSQDGIDLTPEQAAKASSMMYANIENGVIEGYLVPAGGGNDDSSKDGTDRGTGTDKNSDDKDKNITREKAGRAEVKIRDSESSFTVTRGGKTVMTGQLPVKDTGFDLIPAAAAAAVILLMIPVGIVISLKMKLFARSGDET